MIEEARQQVAVGVLSAALAMVGGNAACSDTGNGTPVALYGPPVPEDGVSQDGAADGSGGQDAEAPDGGGAGATDTGATDAATDAGGSIDSEAIKPLYGPQPIDAGPADGGKADTADAEQADAEPADTGPTDTAVDAADVKPDSEPVTFYGPQPVDAGPADADPMDTGPADTKSDSGPSVLYGPIPVDAGTADVKDTGCQPGVLYGPKPCQDDAECDTPKTPGWYCDQSNTFDDGCGGKIPWPLCKAP